MYKNTQIKEAFEAIEKLTNPERFLIETFYRDIKVIGKGVKKQAIKKYTRK